jgi:hypothetical protein
MQAPVLELSSFEARRKRAEHLRMRSLIPAALFPPFVTTGHSRSKNGVASLAYAPVVHAGGQQTKNLRRIFASVAPAWIAGSFDVKTALSRLMSGNDDAEIRSRDAVHPSFAKPPRPSNDSFQWERSKSFRLRNDSFRLAPGN